MNGDIKLSAPGGLPGDIWLDTSDPALSTFSFSGRVVAVDGSPRSGVAVTVFERRSLTVDVRIAKATTDARGGYRVSFAIPGASGSTWDVFVRAEDSGTSETKDSPLLSDVETGAYIVDLVLGAGEYKGRSEWDRVTAKLEPLLGTTAAKDIPADRIEWLSKRADVFPPHLGYYIQAHRLADGRAVKPRSCYAFMRAGYPADLPSLLRIGEQSWESALRNAWARRVLTLPGDGSATAMDTEVADEIAAMRELVVDAATLLPSAGVTQRTLFDTAGLLEADQRTFMQLWVARTGTLADFWANVETALDSTRTQLFQFTIQAATLVGNHVATLEGLQARRSTASIATVRDLAAWSVSDWDTFLNDPVTPIVPPDDVPGADATEKRQNYARALNRIVEDSYPTLSLRHSIERDELALAPPANTTNLVTFLTNNPDFEVTRSTIAHYLNGAVDPWAGILLEDQPAARANLELVQRVYRLTPRIGRYETAKVLLNSGLGSAVDVAGYTREEFVSQYAPLLPADDHDAVELAGKIWDNATQIHSATIGLASQLALANSKADFTPLAIPGGGQFDEATDGLGELSAILGNLDYCACEHCRSVFSPAAYLADLLAFLSKRPAKLAANALEALSERRPDIRKILLDCDNTNTVLPYIDLVNELLEAKYANELTSLFPSHQTTWTKQELRIHPEHLDHDIYNGSKPVDKPITGLVFPWRLPFSLATIEARTYLAHLGVPRRELMARFEPKVPGAAHKDAFAAEVLGLNATEYEIVSGAHAPSPDDREYWGYGVEHTNWVGILNGNWLGVLDGTGDVGDIGELLRRGRYSLDELRMWLELDFVNPDGQITIQWSETCELDDAMVVFLDEAALDRLHRLTRLQRRCGIPARMLNVLLVDACGGTLDKPALYKLADIVRVKQRLGLAWDEVATLWANVVDARVYADGSRALYTRRFLSKEFEEIGNSVLDTFNPAAGGKLQGEATPAIAMTAEQRAIVLAALRVKDEELVTLIGSDLASGTAEALPEFSFANITALFRCVAFARSFGLSFDELATLGGASTGLSGLDLFADPAATLEFITVVDGLRSSGLSVAELDWLLRHVGEGHLDDATTGRELATLARGLATIVEESARLADPDGVALAVNLAELLTEIGVTEIREVVENDPLLDAATKETRIDTHLAAYLDPAYAKNVLVNDANVDYIADVPARRAWLLGQIVSYQRRRALVIDTLAGRFGITADVVVALVFNAPLNVLSNPGGSGALGEVFMPVFADEEAIATGLTPALHQTQFDAWMRVAKAAMLSERFELRADEVTWYSHADRPWLNFNDLPLSALDLAASFDAWNQLREGLTLRSSFRAGELAHQAIADALTLADGVAVFADHGGWDPDALYAVANALGFVVDDLDGQAALLRLRVVAETVKRLGVDAQTLYAWSSSTPTMAQSTAIKTAARAKHDESQWAKIAAALRDVIREQQRDALVDAVLATDDSLRDSNEVFNHLLIDVEMSACMQTSRIVQAISSVQVFIHRALLHLEYDDLTFGSEAIARWEWMKNYRVWEANRKVFLYPENWIEPELRPNKTPEFKTLEATLMQGTIDQARVEKALIGYLETLDRVSNLEIMGVYRNKTNSGDLWVLGRTAAQPYDWFVRRRHSTTGAWHPWEEVPVKIEGDAVALVVYERRVHLFWAVRHLATKNDEDLVTYRLHHVERSDDGWGKTTISEPSQALPVGVDTYGLHVWTVNDELCLGVKSGWGSIRPFILAAFYFHPTDSKSRYVGSRFESSPYWDPAGSFTQLTSGSLVALQPGYDIVGSRYVNQSFATGGVYDVDEHGVVIGLGTWFNQGNYKTQVFANRSSETEQPALVHQVDVWCPENDKTLKLSPVAYDDRQRKYLLEPVPQQDYGGDEGDDASVLSLGNVDITAYWMCPPEQTDVTPRVAPPVVRAQRSRDQVGLTTAWGGNVPGQNEVSYTLNGMDDPVQYGDQAGQVLTNAENDAQAVVDPVGGAGYNNDYPTSPTAFKLKITALYHPFARDMVEALSRQGMSGLYAPTTSSGLFRQQDTHNPFVQSELHLDTTIVEGDAPIEEFDFEYDSPYGLYNWELFFHVPMLIAAKLTAEQRFAEAQQWHHLIFNPIDLVDLDGETDTSKYWRIKPFVEQSGTLAKDQLEAMLGIGVTEAQQATATKKFSDQVKAWEASPFDPHAVARIRPGVYQRTLLRKYIDNLVAWADNLFRRDTLESINEATVLYITIAQLLGSRPNAVPGAESTAKSFIDLAGDLDAFSNALVKLEGYAYPTSAGAKKLGCSPVSSRDPWAQIPTVTRFWYFCYPPNAELLKYWDTIEDRLWKIRHCRNIEGVERQLPLFQPPIDPALLVRATAAGVDIQSVLAELDSGLPPYRFRSVYGRAAGFTATLRGLGSELLAALEKRDAEHISRLRSGHELELLDRVRDLRLKQVDEAKQMLAALEATRLSVDDRRSYYDGLIQEGYSEREKRHFDLAKRAHQFRQNSGAFSILASVLGAIPQLSIKGPEFGGLHLANIANAGAGFFGVAASEYDYHANKASLTATFKRREQDWKHQRSQAQKELARIDRDIVAAEIRIAIANREVENHELQTEQSRELDRYMHSKFTNYELYDWMVRQLSTLYFQTYQLAFDLAKRAERAYRYELAIPAESAQIIKYGYWDSLYKGLLAGNSLNHDLERLDLAYMDRDVRELELRKSVSLAELNPDELRALQETGKCNISLPEVLFDLDHPGQYLRRIRAVRLTIPAVVGPYTTLGARLQLLSHTTRVKPDEGSSYGEVGTDDDRFAHGYGGGEAIATSTAVADGGLFNLDFRDERYLPFEYAGAVSEWELKLPEKVHMFDYRTISDVIVHVDYSAREGGTGLRDAAELAALDQLVSTLDDHDLMQVFAIQDAFPNEWEQFLTTPAASEPQVLNLPIEIAHFPYLAQRQGLVITQIDFALLLNADITAGGPLTVTPPVGVATIDLTQGLNEAYMHGTNGSLTEQPGTWTLSLADDAAPVGIKDGTRLDRSKIAGLVMVVHYNLSA